MIALWKRVDFACRINILLLLVIILLASVACAGTASPVVPPKASPTVVPTPTRTATSLPTWTPTVTPTFPPLSLFPGFVDTGCAWGVAIRQLLDCLASFTHAPLQLGTGAYTASRETLQSADGRTFNVNVFSQSDRVIRNVDGTTYWDLSSLTPTPAATRTPTLAPTATPTPQAQIGALRLYGFRDADLTYVTNTLQWVNSVDPDLWQSVTSVSVSVYVVEPDLLSSVAAISNLVGANRLADMATPFSADRINVRSDYVSAITADTRGSTHESTETYFFAQLARQVRLVEAYRAFRTGGRALTDCSGLTAQDEYRLAGLGFKAQLDAVQRIASNALAKGLIAPLAQGKDREAKIKLFKTDTDQWIKDYGYVVTVPQNYGVVCYPPTPTPVPTEVPPTPTATLAPGMGGLIVFNPYGDAILTIQGPAYQIPAGGQVTIILPAGQYSFTASYGSRSATGMVNVPPGAYSRFDLPLVPSTQ